MERSDHVHEAYEQWAIFYDEEKGHSPFRRIGAVFDDLITRHAAPGRLLLDLGCGTGVSALGFAARGYAVTGCDLSTAMLDIARAKPGAHQVRFEHADIRRLPDLGRFAIAVAMNDPISHLVDDEDLIATFGGVRRLLVLGGLFLFDQHTLPAYRRLTEATTVQPYQHHTVTWSVTEEPGEEAAPVFRMQLDRRSNAGHEQRSSHHHYLRHRDRTALRAALERCGLDLLAVHGRDGRDWTAATDPDGQERSTLLYVARRSW